MEMEWKNLGASLGPLLGGTHLPLLDIQHKPGQPAVKLESSWQALGKWHKKAQSDTNMRRGGREEGERGLPGGGEGRIRQKREDG